MKRHLPATLIALMALCAFAAFPAAARPAAPETTITAGPSGTTTSTSASFSFISSQANSTFRCSLDGSAYEVCTSPKSYSGLSVGVHVFRVFAVNKRGQADQTPAERVWTIESPPPPPPDTDGDGVPDASDNCVNVSNPGQADVDSDGAGDACDTQDNRDSDGDGGQNWQDQCPNEPGPASNNWCPLSPPPAADELRLSYEADRAPDQDLQGANIASSTTQVCVYLDNDPAKTGPVVFFLNGVQGRTEANPPWDYFGGTATVCTLGTFATGTHTIRATWTGGEDSSTFTVGSAPPPPSEMPPTGFVQTFADEFSGTTIDTTKWRPNWFGATDTATSNPVNSNTLSCYDPANVTLSGGAAHFLVEQRQCVSSTTGQTFQYAGAHIDSRLDFRFTYGYFEARMRLEPNTNPAFGGIGSCAPNWMGFWTNGDNWPTTGEIDVMECLGDNVSAHYHSSVGAQGCNPLAWDSIMPASPTGDGYHTFGAHWEANRIRWFYDGQLVCTVTNNVVNASHYLSVNFQVEGADIKVPQTMDVDYVRLWQAPPNPNPPSGDYPEGFPDASTTGPTGTLTPSSGTLTVTTPGTVIANRDHSGAIAIQADNVTVRNSRVTSGASFPIRIFSGADNVTIEDVEVDCNGSATNDSAMVSNGDFDTYRRNDIHECGDGIDPGDFTLIEDNFIHDFNFTGVDPHYDGIQCTGGENGITIRHNTLDNEEDQTSAIICKSDFGPIDDILIENNFLNGGAFTVYSRDGASGGVTYPAPTNDRLLNNWFGGSVGVFQTGTRWGASFGNCTTNGSAWTAKSGNRYWPSGAAVDRC